VQRVGMIEGQRIEKLGLERAQHTFESERASAKSGRHFPEEGCPAAFTCPELKPQT
jgi:hypothetical protein